MNFQIDENSFYSGKLENEKKLKRADMHSFHRLIKEAGAIIKIFIFGHTNIEILPTLLQ